jgi:ParB/RepB/Spo0J family partition protein
MPKLSEAGITRKISIYSIIETGNIRADYTDIEDLAASIKKNTLLEPILVKEAEPEPDGPRYELIAGHRRLRAHFYLVEKGDDFSNIEAKIITGDKLTLQLVENLQRSDLSPRDREKGIWQMSRLPGVTQRDIAAELSKTETYISRQIAAYKTRKIAEDAGVDTSALDTRVLVEIQTAAEKDIPMLVQYAINGGGTVAAAKAVMKDYRPPKKDKPKSEALAGAPAQAPSAESSAADLASEALADGPEKPFPYYESIKEEAGNGMVTVHKTTAQRPTTTINPAPREPPERREIDHKVVDLNDVFDEVYTYMTSLEKRIRENPEEEQAKIDGYKKEAALDIIALVQKRFED